MENNFNNENRDSLPNFDGQTQTNNEREPLPTFEFSGENTTISAPVLEVEQPRVQHEPKVEKTTPPEVKKLADSAFGKALASLICSAFPVASFIAIFLAASGLSKSKKASKLAENYGVSAGGKNIAARIMSIIGLVESISMTAFWAFYIMYFVLIFGAIAAL